MRPAAGAGPLPSARRMVGSIERVPGGAVSFSERSRRWGLGDRCSSFSSSFSSSSSPRRLATAAAPAGGAAVIPAPEEPALPVPGVGAQGSRAQGTQQVEPGVPGRTPPSRHAALCHLSRPQAKILSMMEDNKQLALRIDGAVQSASQEVTNLRAELTATNRRLAELSGGGGPGPGPGPGAAASASAAADSAAASMENHQHGAQGRDRPAPRAEEKRASRTRAWRRPEAWCP